MRERFLTAILGSALLLPALLSTAGAKESGVQRQQRLTPQVSTQVQPNAATTASSNVLLLQYRVGNYTNSTSDNPVAVPLNNAQSTSATFKTTEANQLIIVNYNAECGVLLSGADNEDYLAIQIQIDGKEIYPNSGDEFAFCTGTSTTDFSWVGASRQSALHVAKAGTHTIQILGIGEEPAEWWLGDSSLVIFNGN